MAQARAREHNNHTAPAGRRTRGSGDFRLVKRPGARHLAGNAMLD